MTDEEAFRIYFGVRVAFLGQYDFTKHSGAFKNFKIDERKDLPLVRFLIRKTKTPRELLKLCVGNFLYGNRNVLYSEEYTDLNYTRHSVYLANKNVNFKNDIDILEVRYYNYGSMSGYLKSGAIDDILSSRIRLESFVYIYQVLGLLPAGGYGYQEIVERIKSSAQFLPPNESIKNSIQSAEFLRS